MNKKTYQQPQLQTVILQHQHLLLQTSVNGLNSNAGLDYGGGSNGPARSRSFDGEDDED